MIIKSLDKIYSKKLHALDEVSFELSTGINGLLGANGAGKTTLLKILSTQLSPTSGDVYIYNKSIFKNQQTYRSILGYIPQEFDFPSTYKVEEVLFFLAQLKSISFAQAKKEIAFLLDLVGLETKKRNQIKELSGGMKQRLGIAQAFLGDPKVILLDEPTRSIDIYEQKKILDYISSLNDRIILFSSHITQDIEDVCDHLHILNKGKMTYTGTTKAVLEQLNECIWEYRGLKTPKIESATAKII
ncbi:MAG: ABC transporter ATP-binding protein [Hyphomicrobiales bacterium]